VPQASGLSKHLMHSAPLVKLRMSRLGLSSWSILHSLGGWGPQDYCALPIYSAVTFAGP